MVTAEFEAREPSKTTPSSSAEGMADETVAAEFQEEDLTDEMVAAKFGGGEHCETTLSLSAEGLTAKMVSAEFERGGHGRQYGLRRVRGQRARRDNTEFETDDPANERVVAELR